MDSTKPDQRVEVFSMPTAQELPIALPEPGIPLEQDSEWCVARVNERWSEFRFHDYGDIYDVPGLYERLFYDVLECRSPSTVCGLLADGLAAEGEVPESLRGIDLGAGNGIMGEELRRLGVEHLSAVDIIDSAARASARDRPQVYDAYHVADMTAPPEDVRHELKEQEINLLTCVAALGFGDIPPDAFCNSYDLVADEGWVAFNIKDEFLRTEDRSGFRVMIDDAIADDVMTVCKQKRYRHRLATNGEPIDYMAIVARKNRSFSG